MTDQPVIVSSAMVRAAQAGHKTMTRRRAMRKYGQKFKSYYWPRAKVGDRLWVRETFAIGTGSVPFIYAADLDYDGREALRGRWRSSIYMPKAASRMVWFVTAVKTERLTDISEADAIAEGAVFHNGHGVGHSGWRHIRDDGYVWPTARDSFRHLWEMIHGPGTFRNNPVVVAVTFTVHKTNIERMAE